MTGVSKDSVSKVVQPAVWTSASVDPDPRGQVASLDTSRARPMKKAHGVAVTTVNWNGWRHTLECLAALRRSRGVDWHLIIVDNASTDESAAHLSDLGDDVTTIWSTTNGGWTGGSNLGVEYALEAGYEHILLLNNDAFVEPDMLAQFMAAHARAPDAILGGVLKSEDGLSEGLAGSRMNPATGIPQWLPLAELGTSNDGLLPTTSVVGGALFAHRDVFEAVGPFDDDFYMYYDETDWCTRAAKAGRRAFIAERATLRHVGAGSTGGTDSPLVTYFLTRNSLLFVERYASFRQRWAVWRIVLGRIRMDARAAGARWWPLALLRPVDPCHRARIRGLMDYVLRKFGDCPPVIRTLQQVWRRRT